MRYNTNMGSRAKNTARGINHEEAWQYAIDRLERELYPKLCYHSLWHTCDEVVPATRRLAALEGVTGEDLNLLLTAAYYHDVGYVDVTGVSPEDKRKQERHEARSAEIALEVLPRFGYTPPQLEAIRGMILATKLPQTPHTLLEEILVDADLDSLGREDFWERSFTLRQEMANFGTEFTDLQWYQGQYNFQTTHRYFTGAARRLRDAGKQYYIKDILERLAEAQAQ